MDTFALECSKLPCWAFDPVSSDVLLMPHAKSKSILQSTTSSISASLLDSPGVGLDLPQHSSSFYSSSYNSTSNLSNFDPGQQQQDSKLYLPTLTLASLTPGTTFIFETSGLLTQDSNNNSSNLSDISSCLNSACSSSISSNNPINSIPVTTSDSAYMTLDPLVGSVSKGHDGSQHDSSSSPLVQEASGGLRLPKFEEIHLLTGRSKDAEDSQDDPRAPSFGHYGQSGDSGGGGQDDDDTVVVDADLGEYFSIHDLTSTYSHHTSNSNDSFPQDLKIDDLTTSPSRTLRLSTTSEEDAVQLGLLDQSYPEEDEVLEDDVILDEFEDDEDDKDENSGGSVSTVSSGKAELKCKFCGFVCCSKSSLGIHERRHTGEKPYSCKYCGRLFNSAQCCKHHERLHTGDKPFQCKYCGKKYAVSTRLKRHERVHTREEPYKCVEDGCGKTFRWFDAFRDHRNTHTGVPLYLCSVCGKSFTSYLKFYYHERGHFLKRERDKDKQRLKGAAPGNADTKKDPKGTKAPRKPRGKKAQQATKQTD